MSEKQIEMDQHIIEADSVEMKIICNRSERRRNVIVAIAVILCLLTTSLNAIVTRTNSITIAKSFETLAHEDSQAKQIMVAQDYAMQVGLIAQYESSRAHELEQKMSRFMKEYVSLLRAFDQLKSERSFDQIAIERQGAYINQLMEFIDANGLTVPAPINALQPAPDVDDPLPPVTIEVYDEDGNIVDKQCLVPGDK